MVNPAKYSMNARLVFVLVKNLNYSKRSGLSHYTCKMETVVINVECYWEKRDSTWAAKDNSGREYETEYHGGWDIIGHPPGIPQINGGFGTPDFGNATVEGIRQMFLKRYADYPGVKGKKLKINIKVIKDDRLGVKQIGLESFF